MPSLLIRGGSIITANGARLADVLVQDGVILAIDHDLSGSAHDTMIDATGMLLFPGFIDCHVHFREPGFTHKATMVSESQSAYCGGVTTVCEMPNTNPPTVTIAALADKVRRAASIDQCDVHFFFGVTKAEHVHALRELWTGSSAELQRLKKHCCGVKVYLDHSTGNQGVEHGIIEEIFATCGELSIPLVAHCEDPQTNAEAAAKNASTDVSAHSSMRPPESEKKAISLAIDLARTHQTPLHIAHLSTMQGVNLVRQAKKDGVAVTCEVAPHHLFFTTDDYATLGTLIKMNPPIRSVEHRDALWAGITDGTVDCIATDHAPHLLAEKQSGEPLMAPSGVPGVETMVPLLLSVAGGCLPQPDRELRIMNYELRMQDILRLCFVNPNRMFSLGKNLIEEGKRADIVIVDPRREWVIRGKDLHAKCAWTPYEGWRVQGKIMQTLRASELHLGDR